MKKVYLSVVVALIFVSAQVKAQSGINDLFKGSPGDVNKLLNAYTGSLFKGFGNSLNGGWTNTARTQSLLHFNIRVSASISIVPTDDQSFDINSLGLANIKPTNAGQSISPTFGAPNSNLGQAITVSDPAHPGDPNYQFKTNLPNGVIQYIPAPQLQLTLGLIKSTDITLRYIPTTKITDDVGSVGMFGFGIKHNIMNDFGEAGKIVPFDLAIAVGYTKLTYNKPMDVRKNDNVAIPGQTLDGHFSGWNTQVILSKKLLFFTPFVSVGYLSSTTDVGLHGNFPFVTGAVPGATPGTAQPTYTNYADPISVTGSGAGVSGPRFDAGFQLSLFVLKIFASYSFAQYSSANAGIGLGF
jgi:hypothetical protein